MKLETSSFGEIDIDESKIISFDAGLPGFAQNVRYILSGPPASLGLPDSSPFLWLQSLDDGDIAFIVIDPYSVFGAYDPQISDDDLQSIGDGAGDILIYNLVVVPEDVKQMTVNLAAPILINQKTKKGKQALSSNPSYGVKHYLFKN